MSLTIYGCYRSRATRVIWLANELGLPFNHVPVIQAYRLSDPDAADAPLNTHSASFLRISPQGAIPVMQDGDLVLSESLACNLYLARKYGQPFGPADAVEDALMSQWAFYGSTSIEQDALTILYLHRPGQAQSGADQAAIAHAAERLIRPLQVLEAHLARHGHMVDGRFTVADINMAEIVRYAQALGELIDQFPALRSWLADCQARPAFQQMWKERLAEPE